MNSLTRYRFKTVPIPKKFAKRARREQIEFLERRIYELQKDLDTLKEQPLPLTRQEQTTVLPGEKGYDKLPDTFHVQEWQGDVLSKNLPYSAA